jgi:hypothetical protein
MWIHAGLLVQFVRLFVASNLEDNKCVHHFLSKHFLHWLEALGWTQKILEGIIQIINLEAITAIGKTNYFDLF